MDSTDKIKRYIKTLVRTAGIREAAHIRSDFSTYEQMDRDVKELEASILLEFEALTNETSLQKRKKLS